MNPEENNTNIEMVIENNRPELNAFGGASFGSKYFKTELRSAILNFDEMKRNIEISGSKEFIPNRTPVRIKISDFNMHAIELSNDAQGAPQLILNKDGKGEVRIPYGIVNDKPAFSKVTEDALKKAIRGDNSIIFSDAKKLCEQVNAINNAEIARLETLIENARKWIQGIKTTVVDNKKKADEYEKQLFRTNEPKEGDAVIISPTGGTMQMDGAVVVNV